LGVAAAGEDGDGDGSGTGADALLETNRTGEAQAVSRGESSERANFR